MRISRLLLIFLFSFGVVTAGPLQGSGTKKSFRASDAASINAIISALYDAVSGAAGEKKDWNRLRALFAPDARLMPIVWEGGDRFSLRTLSVDEYVGHAAAYFETRSFYEQEIARRVQSFGSMAHVFSTYAAFETKSSPVPIKRGINSIQLYFDGTRWWILSILWDDERESSPIPPEYLSSDK
jgi:hypothetical protein